MDSDWPFEDPENAMVFTVADIMESRAPILMVCHEEEDGGWQFLTGGKLPDKSAWKLVLLRNVVRLDPTVSELADLPLGWVAARDNVSSPWRRSRHEDAK